MIRRILRAYLSLTRGERNGFFVLAILILFLLMGRVLIPRLVQAPIPDFTAAEKDFLAFRASLEETDNKRIVQPATQQEATPKQSFPFDPNRISYRDLLQLGLSEKVSRTLLNYRESGGEFRTRQDLKKVYGLDQADYDRLEAYIFIEPGQLKKASRIMDDGSGIQKTTDSWKEKEIISFDLNSTDTVELQRIYGIGPVFANRIIRYRDLLGGFYDHYQLKEVYGLQDEQVAEIGRHAFIDTSLLRRINLNTSDREILSRHPYLDNYQSDAIIAYRDFRGEIQEVFEVRQNALLPDSVYERIRPYLEIKR